VTADGAGQLAGLKVRDAASGAERVIAVRGVFYGIGHTPNSDIVAGQVVRSDPTLAVPQCFCCPHLGEVTAHRRRCCAAS